MAMIDDLSRKAKREGDELAGARPLGWLARAGFVARGLVYLIIGVLALKLALGDGGKATNQQGALADDRRPAVRQDAAHPGRDRTGRGMRSGG